MFFKRPSFYTSLQHRFNRKKKEPSNIEDIYDGKLYKDLVTKGILTSGDNVSFLFNTDGVGTSFKILKSFNMAFISGDQ